MPAHPGVRRRVGVRFIAPRHEPQRCAHPFANLHPRTCNPAMKAVYSANHNSIQGEISMPYDPEKHHRRSIRLRHYDYTRPGSYYVTIYTHERQFIFGEITHATACLNAIGNIAQTNWLALPQRFPTIEIDEYIIMPNHMQRHYYHHRNAVLDESSRSGPDCPGIQSCHHQPDPYYISARFRMARRLL